MLDEAELFAFEEALPDPGPLVERGDGEDRFPALAGAGLGVLELDDVEAPCVVFEPEEGEP